MLPIGQYNQAYLPFHVDVELLDALQGEFFPLDQHPPRVPHKLAGDIQHFGWECRGDQYDLQ